MAPSGYQLLPTSLWGARPRQNVSQKKVAAVVGAIFLTGLLGTAWMLNRPSDAAPEWSMSTNVTTIDDLPIAPVPVVGQKDHTGRIQMDLGPAAEQAYNLAGVDDTEEGSHLFFTRLNDFILQKMPHSLQPGMLDALTTYMPEKLKETMRRPDTDSAAFKRPMVVYRNIFQTDKKPKGVYSEAWERMNKNDGWVLDFYSDERAQQWVDDTFGGMPEGTHGVQWAYHYMKRGVLKADFLRYLLPLVKGGVYTDTDTAPKRPIMQWGKKNVMFYDITPTDGKDWPTDLATEPAVIVGVDIDVHERTDYQKYHWEQPLGICQWALSSVPNHPIMVEITRRVVNNTEYVAAKAEETDSKKAALEVLHWTGPVAFTNAVLSYLKARYNVPWQHLRGLRTPLRIGEVMILPITGFSPGGEADFGAEPQSSEQCALVHMFKGSWKGDGA